MGGGGLFLAFGVVCGLLEARRSGRGQVVDAAMIDGVASLMTMVWGYHAQGFYSLERGHNVIDSGAPFYDVYECADGKYVSIGPIEHRFYAAPAGGRSGSARTTCRPAATGRSGRRPGSGSPRCSCSGPGTSGAHGWRRSATSASRPC